MKKFVAVLLFFVSLCTPAVSFAEEHHRFFDQERREHRYREYRRLKAKEQRAYWRWRHEHEDWR